MGRKPTTLDQAVRAYCESFKGATFVQVGAFDGRSDDPMAHLIQTLPLRGVLVEPNKNAYSQLVHTYAGCTNLRLLEKAIASYDGTATMYYVKSGTAGPCWLDQLSSLDQNTILKHRDIVPDIGQHIETAEVECCTFATLFAQENITNVDILVIDAEGLDGELLEQVDLTGNGPAIIQFEHKHMSTWHYVQLLMKFRDGGYEVNLFHSDTVACRNYPWRMAGQIDKV